MKDYLAEKLYHVEILPPKQASEKLEADLESFAEKYAKVMESGHIACITDNAMGNLSFQGTELIEELQLDVPEEQVSIHLNTFHTKEDLDKILTACVEKKIKDILVVTGDGSERLPKLEPSDIGAEGVESVTSVELLRYIKREYAGSFVLGVAFNPYEPADHEFEKMDRKIAAGAEYIITQPVIERHELVDQLISKYGLPVIVEAWMSKKLSLLSDAVGYEIPEDTPYDPLANLKTLHTNYPKCGVYLALVGFKKQFFQLDGIWS
jgi:methylenetetrahydrofolate reductase (NADPH)